MYIVRCKNDSLYVGISQDVKKRIVRHNAGKGAAYTKALRPVFLVWTRLVGTLGEARKVEDRIKILKRPQKERLIAGDLAIE